MSCKYGGREMIEAIPKPNFWRAPTDNDCGNQTAARYGQWKLASLYVTHQNMGEPEQNQRLSNSKVEKLADSVKVTCDPVKELHDMPEFSVMFKLNADYQFMEWYGLGPDDCYSDRKRGGQLGLQNAR